MRIKKKWHIKICFLLGFILCIFPFLSSLYEQHTQNEVIQSYETALHDIPTQTFDQELEKAIEYNDMLFQTQGAYIGNINNELLSKEQYQNLLNVTGKGIMGRIEIPKINVDLPIYHGTDDSVLSKGVGHLEASSLPIGGNNTHSVLTGHRGLPTSKLFTRLDELKENDLFFIKVYDTTYAYQVYQVQVIEPEEVDTLSIQADQDIVSLVTCTPYGINTHRLVVTGKRIPYKKVEKEKIQPKMSSIRELIFTGLPFLVLVLVIAYEVRTHRKEKQNENK